MSSFKMKCIIVCLLLTWTVDCLEQDSIVLSKLERRKNELLNLLGNEAINDGWIIPPNPLSKIGNSFQNWFQENKKINFLVMGCSSTSGAGTDNDYYNAPMMEDNILMNVNGIRKNLGVSHVFFQAFADRLMQWYRGDKVSSNNNNGLKFMNAAQGGSTTYTAAKLMDTIAGNNVDILFWEFSLMDIFTSRHELIQHPDGTIVKNKQIIELFLKRASEMESKPSIILVYFWDAQTWPIQYSIWEEHQEIVNKFINYYGMDISVLLGGKLALNVAINKLNLKNESRPMGNQILQLFSHPPREGLNGYSYLRPYGHSDHHPSRWTHNMVASALEYAFINLILNKQDSTSSSSSLILKHNNVRNVYIPSKENIILKESFNINRYYGGQYIYLSKLTSSITSFSPRFGQPNNQAYAESSEIAELGAKISSLRADRKIDAVIGHCNHHQNNVLEKTTIPYHAHFGIPPKGLKWAAIELSFTPSDYTITKNSKLILGISNENIPLSFSSSSSSSSSLPTQYEYESISSSNKEVIIVRNMSLEESINQWWKSENAIISLETEIKLANKKNHLDMTNNLEVVACVDHYNKDLGLKWIIAYAVPIDVE